MKKVALACGTVAFQLYLITFAMSTEYRVRDDSTKDDAIQAFLIIAYLLLVVGFILLCLMNFSGMDGKLVAIITLIIFAAGAVCAVIGVGIFADAQPSKSNYFAYSLTSFLTAAACAVLAAVFTMLSICC